MAKGSGKSRVEGKTIEKLTGPQQPGPADGISTSLQPEQTIHLIHEHPDAYHLVWTA